ncbi:MAG TPA: hypothetical protein VIY86_08105, partial [Pirellulaceae bacterium]
MVNRNSWSSRTIANHYIRLRRIPDRNVIFLDYEGGVERLPLDQFLSEILTPIQIEVRRRNLGGQIRYIAYSSDFPYAIDFSSRLAAAGRLGALQSLPNVAQFPDASLTSLTYLHHTIGTRGTEFADLRVNTEDMGGFVGRQTQGKRRFSGTERRRTDRDLGNFPLAAVLGYTAGRGNSVHEIVSYLRRAALSDRTHPEGEFYFMRNDDIRSKVRAPEFQQIVRVLRSVGLTAYIEEGAVPPAGRRVLGAMLGISDFVWDSECRIVPGAICENFTSFGGILNEASPQTPLTQLLRLGAVGSTGTVIEPFAIAEKFPHPAMHAHYVQGCTLAESVYQSVLGPYQLLLVGDPLCRPWGVAPQVQIEGIANPTAVRGDLELSPRVVAPRGYEVKQIEWYLDGDLHTTRGVKEAWKLDTRTLGDGHHALTALALTDTAIGHEGRRDVSLFVTNGEQRVECVRQGNA